jgi:hypothetical protein
MYGEEETIFQSSVTVIVELLQLIDVSFTFRPIGQGQGSAGIDSTLEKSPHDIAKIRILCSKWSKKCIHFSVWLTSKQQMQFRQIMWSAQ